ncbi:hypothetical protein LQE88_02030, partial [Acidaminococcus sp. NSJ-142]|nr:hypothetical protein [Acidaminococcus hominis]
MPERRMICRTVVKDSRFLKLTKGAQALYFHLMLEADDDGFVLYSGTFVKTKIDEFLNVSGSRHCSIEQQCREVALCWRDVP